MSRPTDVRPISASLYLLPVRTRMPLKFGAETLTEVTCARVSLTVADRSGRTATGWGETPLSVPWVWPSPRSYTSRHDALVAFCRSLCSLWATGIDGFGHPMEVGHRFLDQILPRYHRRVTDEQISGEDRLPWLAALVCNSPFDLALHDAFGNLHEISSYRTYDPEFLSSDLASFYPDEEKSLFSGQFPGDYLVKEVPRSLKAWHLVGGKDPLGPEDLTGDEPDDGYPVTLPEWIRRDGLDSLKIKLRGDDETLDFDRIVRVGLIAEEMGVVALSADFNCTVQDPEYVNRVLDRLKSEYPRIFDRLLYVEQPFPYDLESHPIDVRSVSGRRPLFLDESAHDWKMIRYGRSLGWTGVALKTCKTQTGALLSLCWARKNGMMVMVQDLTNPMLAQIPHVLLAAHAGTLRGVETNAMQFYPEASAIEARVHPGLYRRAGGAIDLSSIQGSGFGYRVDEIGRELPEPAESASA